MVRRSQQGLPLAGRIMRLLVPEGIAMLCLSREFRHPWLVNLPPDSCIVGAEMDPHGGVAYVLWSATFTSVQPGDPIGEFEGAYNGLRWRKV